MDAAFVCRLLNRGDRLEIARGRLVISPVSGMPVPPGWLKEREKPLSLIILRELGIDVFVYMGYSTGRYGPKLASGIQLQFESLITAQSAYCVFNAELDYCKGSKAGQPLPSGKFRVGERTEFVKFWKRAGLSIPPRLGSFYDYMGNLKKVLFVANYSLGQKLEKKSIQPLVLRYEQISVAFGDKQPHKPHAVTVQVPDKSHTKEPYNKSPQAHTRQGLKGNQTRCETNCGIRLKGSADTRDNVVPISYAKKRPEEQTADEWLADYGEVET